MLADQSTYAGEMAQKTQTRFSCAWARTKGGRACVSRIATDHRRPIFSVNTSVTWRHVSVPRSFARVVCLVVLGWSIPFTTMGIPCTQQNELSSTIAFDSFEHDVSEPDRRILGPNRSVGNAERVEHECKQENSRTLQS